LNLFATIELYGGGEGSGCNPEVGKCGRPPGSGKPPEVTTAEHVPAVVEKPKKPSKPREWKHREHLVGGYFRHGTTVAKVYQTLLENEGKWTPSSLFPRQMEGVQTVKKAGKETGRWHVERSGDQVRMFLKKAGEVAQIQETDQQVSRAAKLANDYITLQKKYGDNIPFNESKALFSSYYQDMGVDTQSRMLMESAVKDWTGSPHYQDAQGWRKVAMDFYQRSAVDEYTSGNPNQMVPGGAATATAEKMKAGVMAMKAYASAYANAHDVHTVYRGINGPVAAKIKEALANAEVVNVPMNVLSSWSSSREQARKFAKGGMGGIVLKMKIDPDNVWAVHRATPWLFSSHSNESEYVVGVRKPTEQFSKNDIEDANPEYSWVKKAYPSPAKQVAV
jgi:hypothetical protein